MTSPQFEQDDDDDELELEMDDQTKEEEEKEEVKIISSSLPPPPPPLVCDICFHPTSSLIYVAFSNGWIGFFFILSYDDFMLFCSL